jgi:hypothetical protein
MLRNFEVYLVAALLITLLVLIIDMGIKLAPVHTQVESMVLQNASNIPTVQP